MMRRQGLPPPPGSLPPSVTTLYDAARLGSSGRCRCRRSGVGGAAAAAAGCCAPLLHAPRSTTDWRSAGRLHRPARPRAGAAAGARPPSRAARRCREGAAACIGSGLSAANARTGAEAAKGPHGATPWQCRLLGVPFASIALNPASCRVHQLSKGGGQNGGHG